MKIFLLKKHQTKLIKCKQNNNEIEELEEKKSKLEEYKTIVENKLDNSDEIENSIKLEEKRLELLKFASNNLQENRFKDTELDVNQKIKDILYHQRKKVLKSIGLLLLFY